VSDSDRKQGAAVELGLAGKTARAFIHSPLSPLLFLAMLAMGLLGLMATPRQEDPQISVPMVDIMFALPGASSGLAFIHATIGTASSPMAPISPVGWARPLQGASTTDSPVIADGSRPSNRSELIARPLRLGGRRLTITR